MCTKVPGELKTDDEIAHGSNRDRHPDRSSDIIVEIYGGAETAYSGGCGGPPDTGTATGLVSPPPDELIRSVSR
ncbi:hypothetical protein Trydic_g17522 [Trypoxylus dichotomus]